MTLEYSRKRVALITGAASGLGASFADCLARENYDLVLVDRNEKLLKAGAEDIARRHAVSVHVIQQDLTRPEAVANIRAECDRLKVSVDFLINNAGCYLTKLVHELPWPVIEDNIQLLLNVVLEMTHNFLPDMTRQRWGRIINVASVSGFMPGGVGVATYNATKTFLIPFTEALNFELEGTGIHVSAVCPGFMKTNLFVNSGLPDVRDTVPGFMWLDPRQVAEKSIAAVMRNQPVYVAGLINRGIVTVAKFVPRLLLRERTRIFHRSVHARLASPDRSALHEKNLKRVALVTGATSGIGASFCKVLAAEGCNIILVARREDLLRRSAEELATQYGIEARVIVQDLTVPQAVEAICAKLEDIGWSVDILVNNAGYPVAKTFASMSWAEVDAALQLYIKSVVRLTHALVPGMTLRKWGRVINVASLAAFEPGSFQSSLYSSSKAFQVAISESIAAELEGTGVTVTAVCPGFTKTEWMSKSNLEISSVPKSLWMESDAVAKIGLQAAMRGRAVCLVGTLPMRIVSLLFQLGPRRLIGSLLSKKRRKMAR